MATGKEGHGREDHFSRLCGSYRRFALGALPPEVGEGEGPRVSENWKEAYAAYRRRRPILPLYGEG